MSEFKVGDRVVVDTIDRRPNGREGTIIEINEAEDCPYLLKIDVPGWNLYEWRFAAEELALAEQYKQQPAARGQEDES